MARRSASDKQSQQRNGHYTWMIILHALAMSGKYFCSTLWPGKGFMMLLTIAVALSQCSMQASYLIKVRYVWHAFTALRARPVYLEDVVSSTGKVSEVLLLHDMARDRLHDAVDHCSCVVRGVCHQNSPVVHIVPHHGQRRRNPVRRSETRSCKVVPCLFEPGFIVPLTTGAI